MASENRTSFAELLSRRGDQPLPPGEALIYLKSIVASVERLHQRGLVHGDVKAESVMVDSQGTTYLEGVGFAQHIGSRSVVRAPLEAVPHLAPELVSYQEVTEAADVYSLGVLLYEMLAGETPSTRSGKLRSPSQVTPAVPQALSQVVMRAMSPNPADRFQKPGDLFTAACSALNLSPGQVPDRPSPATLILASAATIQAPQTVAVQPYPQESEMQVVGPATQVIPVESEFESQPSETARSRPVWMWVGIAVVGFIILLCVGFLVGSRIPKLVAGLSTTNTPTWTASALPSDTALPSATVVDTATLPPPPAATDTQPPEPTLEPSPTFTFPPPPTVPPVSASGDLQVRNRYPYGIYVFRDRTVLNTSPIPSGMYLIFFNQPAGIHLYRFCRDLQMNECQEKQIEINGDVEITVP